MNIKQIMALASQSIKPTKKLLDAEEDIDTSQLFDKKFDETENIKDQYEKIFDIKTTKGRNFGGAFIGDSKSTWEDVKGDLDFEVTNDSMLANNIRAETNPDSAPPTQSRETLQSLSKLNVSKPIDIGQNMRLSKQTSMNYRFSDETLDGDVADDSYLTSILKSGAIFGLKTIKKEVKKVASDKISIDKIFATS